VIDRDHDEHSTSGSTMDLSHPRARRRIRALGPAAAGDTGLAVPPSPPRTATAGAPAAEPPAAEPHGTGVTGTVLAAGSSPDPVRLATHGPTDVVVRELTLQPGGSTGWHYHPGQVVAVVKSGTLTRILPDGSVETDPAGSVVIEDAGRHHTHLGRNLGTDPVVLLITYLLPLGDPLSVDTGPPTPADEDPPRLLSS
jgi:quercetin dioxygenase-like cupin family protein